MKEEQNIREKYLLDFDWKFHLGNASDLTNDFNFGLGIPFAKAGESVGAVKMDFDDSNWRVLNIPHDWAVEQEFVNINDDDVKSHGYKPVGRQFPKTTIGWYRKAVFIPKSDEGKRISVHFDGVFRDCIVWLNGHYLGNNLSGYSEFTYDLSDYIKYGQKNMLVVRVDASQYEGWFYEGAGIYRHVWLNKYSQINIPEYGIFVYSDVKDKSAKINIETKIYNQSSETAECELHSIIVDANNRKIGTVVSQIKDLNELEKINTKQEINITVPTLWSLENPYLYKLISLVKCGGKTIDSVETTFGIRTVFFDEDRGFFLNGKPVKIKGVCCHQDHAGVGSALPDRLQFYRIERLKEMGCNAYRTSHNPPTTELLEACDRLGMLVMDENRLMGSSPEMKAQFENLILRDRNHPSVIIWSLGNEEHLIQNSNVGKSIAKSLMQKQKQIDPTRICTYAGNNGNQFEGINSIMPVRGFNYMNISNIDEYRKDHPNQILIGSEEASTLCTRGIYENDTVKGYVSDYDQNKPGWGATAEQWSKFFAEREWLAGAFVWTGFDYRGEPTPYSWPCINSHFGIMDVCGFPKNNYYYYQSWWSDKEVLHIFPHWNWKGKEGKIIDVCCFSNCETVELFLNGVSLGKKNMNINSHLEWKVPYQSGILEARGTKNGKTITHRVETTGEAEKIILSPDRTIIKADGEDISVINLSVSDSKGREVPIADNLITFDVVGNGKIIGVGNGDPSSHEPDKYLSGKYQRNLFNGKCQVILQSEPEAGEIELVAFSNGLKSGNALITSAEYKKRGYTESLQNQLIKHKALGKKMEYKIPFSQKYAAGGNNALVNGLKGTLDFKDGLWQGFEENDLDVIIDLKESVDLKYIEVGFLEDINSWIFLPLEVKLSCSNDGNTYNNISVQHFEKATRQSLTRIKNVQFEIKNIKTRFLRVSAKNIGVCPEWHAGAGGKAWLFIDEIVVR